MNNKKEAFLKLLGAKGTIDILQYLQEKGAAQHREFIRFLSFATLLKRLRELLEFGLVEHHLQKEGVRKEWYELTEMGEKALKFIHELLAYLEK